MTRRYQHLGDTEQAPKPNTRRGGHDTFLTISSKNKVQGWPWPRPFGRLRRRSRSGSLLGDQIELMPARERNDGPELTSLPPMPRSSLLDTFSLRNRQSFLSEIDNKIKRRRWVQGALICAYLASSVLFVNIILAIIAVMRAYDKHKSHDLLVAPIYEGKCSISKNSTTGSHLLISYLSMVTLGASGYCMQCLGSPTRADADKAHSRGSWLEIGTASISNLRFVGRRRVMLWFLLLASSLPLHFIYNSVIFASTTVNQHNVLIAPNIADFGAITSHGKHYDDCFEETFNQTVLDFLAAISNDNVEHLSPKECIDMHSGNSISDQGILVLLANDLDSENVTVWNVPAGFPGVDDGWMCQDLDVDVCEPNGLDPDNWRVRSYSMDYQRWDLTAPSQNGPLKFNNDNFTEVSRCGYHAPPELTILCEDMEKLNTYLEPFRTLDDVESFLRSPTNWANSSWAEAVTVKESSGCAVSAGEGHGKLKTFKIEGCLSQKVPESCQIMFSLPIALGVLAMNIINVICMFLAARDNRAEVLLTVGDAISSYLTRPDPNSRARCLLSKSNVFSKAYTASSEPRYSQVNLPKHLPKRKRWFHASSRLHWAVTIAIYLICVAFCTYLLYNAITSLKNDGSSGGFRNFWNIGFGNPHALKLITPLYSTNPFSLLFLANTPQLIISLAYFLYNRLLTSMLLAAEYTDYSLHRKYLRVSRPKGNQRSSYYLSLPHKYSLTLLAASAILHWLASQSLYYVRRVQYDIHGTLLPDGANGTLAVSPLPLILTICLAIIMLLVALGLGTKPFGSRMPLAANCSAGISAACHPPAGDADAALKSVMWGETATTVLEELEVVRRSTEGGDDGKGFVGSRDSTVTVKGGAEDKLSIRASSSFAAAVDDDGGVGHCSFTSQEVVRPSAYRLYT
ncbi:hypothetical protein FQN51_000941 [Onygenales sp. PD_10]|nr:hypothetical protein FQN51_000941 [Onygenales sp. PD_10]